MSNYDVVVLFSEMAAQTYALPNKEVLVKR